MLCSSCYPCQVVQYSYESMSIEGIDAGACVRMSLGKKMVKTGSADLCLEKETGWSTY